MGYSATNYLKLLQSLLPLGKLWNRNPDSVLTQELTGEAQELARVDDRSTDLIAIERDSRFTTELIDEWEEELALPNTCFQYYGCLEPQTLAQRRSRVHNKHTRIGGQHKGFYIEYMAEFGYTLSIVEWLGSDRITHYLQWMAQNNFTQRANVIYFQTGTHAAGNRLSTIPFLEPMPCLLNEVKPGHTTVIVGANSPGFGFGFGLGFDRVIDLRAEYGFGFGPGFHAVRQVSDCILLEGGAFGQGFDFGYDRILTGGFAPWEFGSGFDGGVMGINQFPYTGDFNKEEFCFGFNIN